jgi:hypothetical protein
MAPLIPKIRAVRGFQKQKVAGGYSISDAVQLEWLPMSHLVCLGGLAHVAS